MAFRKNKSDNAILLNQISKQISELSEKKSRHERLGAILANWSQVAMLLVVLYGYVYTVLPVIQKEQIAEQLAELELEKKTWDKQFNEANNRIDKKNKELQQIINSKNQLIADISKLKQEKLETKSDLNKIKDEYIKVNIELKKSKESIDTATNDLLEQNKQSLLGNTKLPENFISLFNNSMDTYEIFQYEHKDNIKEKLKQIYESPLVYANKSLVALYESYKSAKGVDKTAKYKLYNQYKNGINKHQIILTCPMPNFEAWEASFVEAKPIADSLTPQCIDNYFNERIHNEKWSPDVVSQLKKSEFWPNQTKIFSSSCIVDLRFRLQDIFRDAWDKVESPCKDRLFKVNNIILDDFEPSKLKPFTDVSPPSKEFIIHKLKAKD